MDTKTLHTLEACRHSFTVPDWPCDSSPGEGSTATIKVLLSSMTTEKRSLPELMCRDGHMSKERITDERKYSVCTLVVAAT